MTKHVVNQNRPPGRSGGGTVFFVSNSYHRFLSNRSRRFECGTPNVIGIIRTEMIFLVKRRIHNEHESVARQTNNHQQIE